MGGSSACEPEGWLIDPNKHWSLRFHRDQKSWRNDLFVFLDKGRAMPDGSPALLKSRRHLPKQHWAGAGLRLPRRRRLWRHRQSSSSPSLSAWQVSSAVAGSATRQVAGDPRQAAGDLRQAAGDTLPAALPALPAARFEGGKGFDGQDLATRPS